jgi:hypothetical protein
MDLLKLFSPDYLFASVPGSEFHTNWLFYGFFLLLFVASFWVRRVLEKRPHARIEVSFFGGVPYRMREIAVVGLLFTFFRDQNLPYLGMRVFLLVILLWILFYAIWVVRNYKKNFAHLLATLGSKKEEDKYKPRAKKRR